LLFLSAIVGFAGMHLLSACAVSVKEKVGGSDLDIGMKEICRHANARLLPHVFDIALVLACSGAIISSLMIIGDSLVPLATDEVTGKVHISRQEWILIVFCGFAFPLSCLRQLAFLRITSYLSLAMTFYMVALVVTKALTQDFPEFAAPDRPERGEKQWIRMDNMAKVLQAVPVFTFCFCGHMNMLPIVNELINPTLVRLNVIIVSASLAAGVIYSTLAIAAYESFGNNTPQDLLTFYSNDQAVKVARVGMAVVCAAFYPLLVQPVRRVLIAWLVRRGPNSREQARRDGGCSSNAENLAAATDAPAATSTSLIATTEQEAKLGCDRFEVAHWGVTILVGAVALCIAISTKSLGKCFSLSGATGFALLCNICPAWAYLSLVPGRSLTQGTAWLLLVLGVLTMPVCVVANLVA
jgi:amino acid permease